MLAYGAWYSMEEVESLQIAVVELAREHQELKKRLLLLENAIRFHVNNYDNAHQL